MNQVTIKKLGIRLTGLVACIVSVCVIALTASRVVAQPGNKAAQSGKLSWTKENARSAFTAALTRSAQDSAYRTELVTSTDSAKKAVAKEGNIEIPREVVIMFYEPTETPTNPRAALRANARSAFRGTSNDNYHVFALPPADGKQHFYKDQLRCCYPAWTPPPPPPPDH
jgi:hypothetical protein